MALAVRLGPAALESGREVSRIVMDGTALTQLQEVCLTFNDVVLKRGVFSARLARMDTQCLSLRPSGGDHAPGPALLLYHLHSFFFLETLRAGRAFPTYYSIHRATSTVNIIVCAAYAKLVLSILLPVGGMLTLYRCRHT